ncbi:MAG: SpoIIE family protein phosphatase [Candidatus Riflebacteria bacterium]|nr:SpoIIE family protein phosphatase [Candidatus Riflebacteria bacterium]
MSVGARRGAGLLPLLLFILLLGVIGWALSLVDLVERERRTGAEEELGILAGTLARRLDPEMAGEAAGRRLLVWCQRRPGAGPALHRRLAGFRRVWGPHADPGVFGPDGRLRTPASMPLHSRFIMQKLWDILTGPANAAEREEARLARQFSTLFGPDFLPGVLRTRPGRARRFRSRNREGLVWWRPSAPGQDRAGLLCIFWRIPRATQLLRPLVEPLRRRGLHLGIATADHRLRPLGARWPRGWLAVTEAMLRAGHTSAWAGRMGAVLVPPADRRLVLARAFPRADLDPARRGVWLAGGVLALGMLLLLGRGERAGLPGFRLTVGRRSLLIFLLAALFPLLGLAFLGMRTLQDRQTILQTRAFTRARLLLGELDREFLHDQDRFLERCRALQAIALASRVPPEPTDIPPHLGYWELRSLTGEFWGKSPPAAWARGTDLFFDAFGKATILQHLEDRLASSGRKVLRPPDPVTQQLLSNPQLGFSHILLRADAVHLTQFAKMHLYWFWDVFHDDSHPLAYMTVMHSLAEAWDAFLDRRLPPGSAPLASPPIFLVKNLESGVWYPRHTAIGADLEELAHRCALAGDTIHRPVTWKGEPGLALAAPGRHFYGHVLVAIQPTASILAPLAPFRQALALAWLIGLGIALACGWVLADLFLAPVGDLAGGLAALARRDPAVRIPADRADEFGDLARAFNLMVENLKELELARVVQEALLPAEFPIVPGCSGAVWNRPATHLGGDYCDFFPLADGRLMAVIGDATGHGVAAALVMSMVKAEVFDFAGEPGPLPGLLARLDRLLMALTPRKLKMTFCVVVLDPATGDLEAVNAGHPFPILLSRQGSAQEWPMTGFPLGFAAKGRPQRVATFPLTPGGQVVLVTDGLFEVASPQGQPFGYDALRQSLQKVGWRHPAHVADHLREVIDRFRGPCPFTDDCTIVVVRWDGPAGGTDA